MASNSDAEERGLAIERLLESPMPWIGVYVAAASLLCTAAMVADASHAFLKRKSWFPSKYFSLNATSLTLLEIAMKLPMDLTTSMYTITDRVAKISTLVFMSTAISNFMTSIGSMNDAELLSNVVALAILVVAVTGNVFLQVIELRSYLNGRLAFPEEMLAIGIMLLLLVMCISSSIMIPSAKKYMESRYHEMNRCAFHQDRVDAVGGRTINPEKLEIVIKKYWVMAETSSPQFVIARSVTCIMSDVLSLLVALVLVEAEVRMAKSTTVEFLFRRKIGSSYGRSTKWVLLTQTFGVIVGSIAPAFRWYNAVKTRALNGTRGKSFRNAVMVEDYWIQKLVDWSESSLSVHIRDLRTKKLVHHLRGMFLKFFIYLQCLIVRASKLVLLISIYITSPIIRFLEDVKIRLKRQTVHESHPVSGSNRELDLNNYVMLLHGEEDLLIETIENIGKEVDKVINKGKMRKPMGLLRLVRISRRDLEGVVEFDSPRVGNLIEDDDNPPPYCWSLPVVTLACIALALPDVEEDKSRLLLSSVDEGLRYVKIIDKILDKKESLANIRMAADVLWVDVEVYHKWQDRDLRKKSSELESSEEILQELCDRAKKMVVELDRGSRNCVMRNPLNWPAKVIAANSMYRVSATILQNHGGECGKTNGELFEQISVMIADILTACLANLGHVITKKCQCNVIEERERSVREAALLLGETEDVLAFLMQRELPVVMPGRAVRIEEWRALMKQDQDGNESHA
ncbi:hypothetical protein OROMI_016825 [Orobanche minor]